MVLPTSTPQAGAFSGVLMNQKSKSPPFCGGGGRGGGEGRGGMVTYDISSMSCVCI